VLANVDLFQNFNTQFTYNNSYIYTENTTFIGDILIENLETRGNLTIDGGVFSQKKFNSFTYSIFGNVVCSENTLQMYPSSQIKIQHFQNISQNYSLSFDVSLSDLTAESQSLFTTNNSILNITTINNIELVINDQILAGNTMLSLNTFYKICLIFNNGTYSIYINDSVDIVGNLDVIDFGNFTIGNNILLPIEIQNFTIKENNNNNTTLFEMKIENYEVFFYGNQTTLNLGTNLEVFVPTIFKNDVNTDNIFTDNIYVTDTAYLSNLSISYLNIGNNFIVNESNVNFLNDITMNGNLYVTGNSFLQNIKFDGNIICENNGNGSVQLGVDNENNSIIFESKKNTPAIIKHYFVIILF
jgi:hypothetical protein